MSILSMIALLLDRKGYFYGFNEYQRSILRSIINNSATPNLSSILEEFGEPNMLQWLDANLEALVNKAQEYQIIDLKSRVLVSRAELASTHNLHVITQIAEGARALASYNNPSFLDILDGYEDWSISHALQERIEE